ncbi:MAG: radical SAM protein [Patescibacteria group bacterium]
MGAQILLSVDATEKCNFGCTYCYKGEKEQRSIDLDVFVKALERAWPLIRTYEKGMSLSFMGGEPLCDRPIIEQIIKICVEKCEREGVPFKWGLTTNLSLLDDDALAFIKKYGGSLHCSIDGDRISHDLNRPLLGGQSSFDKMLTGAKLALASGAKGARLTITPATVPYFYDNMVFLAKLGFKGIAAFPALNMHGWTPEVLQEFSNQVEQVCKERFGALKSVDALRPLDVFAYAFNFGLEGGNPADRCGVSKTVIAVDLDGKFMPCHRFTNQDDSNDFEIVHLQGTGDNTWHSLRTRLENTATDQCENCNLFGPCRGGCWAETRQHGELGVPPQVHCDFQRALWNGVVQSKIQLKKETPRPNAIPVSGEASCISTDFCAVCDCSCTKFDLPCHDCGRTDVRDKKAEQDSEICRKDRQCNNRDSFGIDVLDKETNPPECRCSVCDLNCQYCEGSWDTDVTAEAKRTGFIPEPKSIPVSGEASCVTKDVCIVCDCSAEPGCGGYDQVCYCDNYDS